MNLLLDARATAISSIRTSFLREVTEYTKTLTSSLVSSISSKYVFPVRITNSSNTRIKVERFLRELDPAGYEKHTEKEDIYSSTVRFRNTLKRDTAYIIPLPENTFILVHVTRDLNLFFFGKKGKEASILFTSYLSNKNSNAYENDKKYITVYSVSTEKETSKFKIDSSTEIFTKSLSDIYTSESNKKYLVTYLDRWAKAGRLFQKFNITHKLGILLYGPPGTGKTSLAKAIAQRLDYPIYVLNPSSFPDKVPDLSPLTEDEEGIVILLEDIDYAFQDFNGAKANALLQTLDGATSSANIIFIATTNSIEKLSDAFVRDGRFDLKIFMDNINDYDTAHDMCASMELSDDQICDVLNEESFPINPAYLQNKCIQYIFNHLGDIKDEDE